MARAAVRPLGFAGIDGALGGGLAQGRLHEVFAREGGDAGSALGFAAMLALCLTGRAAAGAPLLWLRAAQAQRRAPLHGPGLAELGLDPGRLILGLLPDAKTLLRASVDALRCEALGAVILELGGNPPLLDLTASRRLTLAAEATGVTPLLLRLGGDARPGPSAAHTRWQVAGLPSAWRAADAPGAPTLALSLLRQRGGQAGRDWNVEWDRDAVCFRPAPLSGARLSLSGGGSLSHDRGQDDAGSGGWRSVA